MSVLRVDNLQVRSGSLSLVDNASLELEPGTPLVLLGETGSGKSILLAAIMGTLPRELVAEGTIELFGTTSRAGNQAARHTSWGSQIAILPQEPWFALDPTMRCLPQVAEGYDEAGRRELAREALEKLGLANAEKKLPKALSGGMAQRVAFAAARAGGANLLLADEPTKGLDSSFRRNIVPTLMQAVEGQGSLLAVTHDVEVARMLGGRAAIMWQGRIIEQGPTEELLNQPRHPYTRELIAAAPASWPTRDHPSNGQIMLSAHGISKTFGGQSVLRDFQCDIRERERITISGPSGSGKSTLGNILIGLIPPDSGTIRRTHADPHWKFQKLYQDPAAAFAPRVTIRRSLKDLVYLHRIPWKGVEESMAKVRLSENLLDRLPGQVSGGELQRFAIVRALLLEPHFLFADEPTSRLDPITQRQVMDILIQTTARQDCSLMVVTHDADIAKNVAHRHIEVA